MGFFKPFLIGFAIGLVVFSVLAVWGIYYMGF